MKYVQDVGYWKAFALALVTLPVMVGAAMVASYLSTLIGFDFGRSFSGAVVILLFVALRASFQRKTVWE